MITPADIAHWRQQVPWIDPDQVEQDLVLSRLIIEIANDPLLGDELVFRGGTCFHKLWLERPWRYSEDLDYVRRTGGGIGEILGALRSIGERVGFDKISTAVGTHPKVRFRSTFAGGTVMQIKVEMNTFERVPARPLVTRTMTVNSPWYSSASDVRTFDLPELIATKIRALFQRKKGRDLFDLWLAIHHAGAPIEEIAACFEPYRPDGWTVDRAVENLDAKLSDRTFTTDLNALVADWPDGYSIESASRTVIDLLELLR